MKRGRDSGKTSEQDAPAKRHSAAEQDVEPASETPEEPKNQVAIAAAGSQQQQQQQRQPPRRSPRQHPRQPQQAEQAKGSQPEDDGDDGSDDSDDGTSSDDDAGAPAPAPARKRNAAPNDSWRNQIWKCLYSDANAAPFASSGPLGKLPSGCPQITVESVGQLKLPLSSKQAVQLRDVAQQAPYGKGTETVVDTKVRDALQVGAVRLCMPF